MHLRQTLALVPILAFPAAGPPANGPWSAPVTLDRGTVAAPSVAVDARDRAAATWLHGPREVRALLPSGRTTVVARSATQRLRTPEVATTSRGAVVAWTRQGRVETRTVSAASGRLSTVSRLSPAGRDALDPTFVGGTGGTVLAWQLGRDEPELQIGLPRSDGRFAGTLRYTLDSLEDLDFTTTRGGGLFAAYTRRRGADGRIELMAAEQRAGSSRLVEIARMPQGTAAPRDPAVAVTSAGTAVVAWAESAPGGGRVMVAQRPRGGVFGDPVAIAAGGQASRVAVLPKSDGTVTLAWVATRTTSQTAAGALRVADLRDLAARTMAGAIGDYTAAVDGRGGVHFAWITNGRVSTRLVDDRGQLGRRRTLTAPGERARTVALGAGARDVVALWTTGRAVRLSSR